MPIRAALFALFALTTPVLAQTVPAPAAPPAAAPANARLFFAPPDVTLPKGTNRHGCAPGEYFPGAIRGGTDGQATVVYTIGTDGKVHDPAVAVTSGSDAIDRGAITCVLTFEYTPAQYNGAPLALTWYSTVTFNMSRLLVPHATIDFAASTPCTAPPMSAAVTGAAVLLVDVGADGKVAQTNMADASGDAAFDSYATTCMSRWIYKPATSDGKAVAVRTVAIVSPTPH